jgi:hypothetical protein
LVDERGGGGIQVMGVINSQNDASTRAGFDQRPNRVPEEK